MTSVSKSLSECTLLSNVPDQVQMQERGLLPSQQVRLSTQSGRLPLPTQGDGGVCALALRVQVHQGGPRCAGAAVPRAQGAVAAAAGRRAEGPGQRVQLPGVGPPGGGGPRTGGELQRLGSLQGADEGEGSRVRDGRSGGLTPLGDREDDGGLREAGDVEDF